MNDSQKEMLEKLLVQPIKWQQPLANYTSLLIGGPAEALCTLNDRAELQELLTFAEQWQIPWRTIGRGTNLLAADEGFAGIIIVLGKGFQQISPFKSSSEGRYLVKAGGGCSLARLSMCCMEEGLAGLEFAVGIPGSLAGAVVMNAGAWGGQIADVLTRVELIAATGPLSFTRSEMTFGYRCWHDFAGQNGKAVIVAVEVELSRDTPELIRERCRVFQDRRRQSQPTGFANAGSFFKNPANDSAGRLIEASGCKGLKVGGAMVSPAHANFLVNTGGATAADIINLMMLVQARVKKESGIELEPEVHFIR